MSWTASHLLTPINSSRVAISGFYATYLRNVRDALRYHLSTFSYKWHLIAIHAPPSCQAETKASYPIFFKNKYEVLKYLSPSEKVTLSHNCYLTCLTHKVHKPILSKCLLDPTIYLSCMASLFLLTISTKDITIARGITVITTKNNIINISQESIFKPKSLSN